MTGLNYSQDYEKLFFLNALKNPKYFDKFYNGFFSNNELDILADIAKKFYEKFKEVPSKDQIKLLVQKSTFADKIDNELINLIFDTNLNEYDPEWLKSISESWIKWRNFDRQLIKTVEYIKLQSITPDKVDGIIDNAINMLNENGKVNFDSDLGLDFFNAEDHIQEKLSKIQSGKDFIDRRTGGYDKKTLICYCGQSGIGKSIWLCNDAANFVEKGYNVVYISAEMSAKKVAKRIGANLLNIKMDEYDLKSKDVNFMKRKLQNVSQGVMPPGRLIIKEFPTSQASILDIEAYLKDLEETKDFKVNVLIVDYINILANYRNPNTENTYIKIKQIAEDLRGLAVKRDLLVISATQIGKAGWDSTDVKIEHISESAGLAHTCDLIYAIIQDEMMHVNNEYWLKILKIRDGEGLGIKCRFEIDYNFMRLKETGDITSSEI